MVLRFFFALSLFLFFGCTQVERDSPLERNHQSSSETSGSSSKCGNRTEVFDPDLYKCVNEKGVSKIYLKTPVSYSNESYEAVLIGTQTWLARNLNYNADGSKCCDNQESYCQKYGRLYDWETAKKSCPAGWHLPNSDEWKILIDFVGDTDDFGFAALPGGYDGSGSGSGSYCLDVGIRGSWWSSSELNANTAHRWALLT